jgi:hypothetical protein
MLGLVDVGVLGFPAKAFRPSRGADISFALSVLSHLVLPRR